MPDLVNIATAAGMFDTLAETANSTVTVLVTDLWIEKTADKPIWSGGELTYTVTIENMQGAGGTPLTELSLTDTIDTTIATLVPGSVTLNSTTLLEAQYTFTGGVLTIPDTTMPVLQPGERAVVTFRVSRV